MLEILSSAKNEITRYAAWISQEVYWEQSRDYVEPALLLEVVISLLFAMAADVLEPPVGALEVASCVFSSKETYDGQTFY